MIFNTRYALSKWPHLHRAYVISGCIFFLASCTIVNVLQSIKAVSSVNFHRILLSIKNLQSFLTESTPRPLIQVIYSQFLTIVVYCHRKH